MPHKKSVMFIPVLVFFFQPGLLVGQVSWVKNFDDALKQASAEKKCLVLDLSASW